MTLPAPTYDLMLLLDPQADEAPRAKIVADTRAAIEAQGELLRHDDWGERPLAYPIERKSSAEYHLLQFHAGTSDLLTGLDRSLRITDGLLRFRIVKLKPGVPDAPDVQAASAATRPSEPTAEAHAASERHAAPEAQVAPETQADAETPVGEPA
jgi:small subunit ribosomal protein S6